MNDTEFRAFLDLLMCSDPSPLPEADDKLLVEYADRASRERGYDGWIEAYHRLGRERSR